MRADEVLCGLEETVDHGVQALVMLQQRVLVVPRDRLEQPHRQAEGALALEFGAGCGEDAHPRFARDLVRRGEQPRLPAARRSFTEHRPAGARGGIVQALPQHRKLALALHQAARDEPAISV